VTFEVLLAVLSLLLAVVLAVVVLLDSLRSRRRRRSRVSGRAAVHRAFSVPQRIRRVHLLARTRAQSRPMRPAHLRRPHLVRAAAIRYLFDREPRQGVRRCDLPNRTRRGSPRAAGGCSRIPCGSPWLRNGAACVPGGRRGACLLNYLIAR